MTNFLSASLKSRMLIEQRDHLLARCTAKRQDPAVPVPARMNAVGEERPGKAALEIEPLITIGKSPSLANKRLAFSRLRDRDAVVKLFGELGPRYEKRPGGYTRILKMGFRVGDNAPMAFVELVDRPEPVAEEAKTEAAKAD